MLPGVKDGLTEVGGWSRIGDKSCDHWPPSCKLLWIFWATGVPKTCRMLAINHIEIVPHFVSIYFHYCSEVHVDKIHYLQ